MTKTKEKVVVDTKFNAALGFYYYVETEEASYRSQNLSRCLRLWREHSQTDHSEVINVGSVGV